MFCQHASANHPGITHRFSRKDYGGAVAFGDILAELAVLRARVDVLEAGRLPGATRDDPALLQAIEASVRGHVFTARELFQHARVDQALGAALAGLRSPKQVGKRLRALAGRELGGLLLQRIGRDQSGTIWAVQVSPDLHAAPSFSSHVGA